MRNNAAGGIPAHSENITDCIDIRGVQTHFPEALTSDCGHGVLERVEFLVFVGLKRICGLFMQHLSSVQHMHNIPVVDDAMPRTLSTQY
jgi:hypothetical protein